MYALICLDRPDCAALRAGHLEFLKANSAGVYESVAVRAFKQVFPQK